MFKEAYELRFVAFNVLFPIYLFGCALQDNLPVPVPGDGGRRTGPIAGALHSVLLPGRQRVLFVHDPNSRWGNCNVKGDIRIHIPVPNCTLHLKIYFFFLLFKKKSPDGFVLRGSSVHCSIKFFQTEKGLFQLRKSALATLYRKGLLSSHSIWSTVKRKSGKFSYLLFCYNFFSLTHTQFTLYRKKGPKRLLLQKKKKVWPCHGTFLPHFCNSRSSFTDLSIVSQLIIWKAIPVSVPCCNWNWRSTRFQILLYIVPLHWERRECWSRIF